MNPTDTPTNTPTNTRGETPGASPAGKTPGASPAGGPATTAAAHILRVHHRTEYRYDADVHGSYGLGYLVPRDGDGQRCLDRSVTFDPEPSSCRERRDAFGNRLVQFDVQVAHRSLVVEARSVVAIDRPAQPVVPDSMGWEEARSSLFHSKDPEATYARRFTLDSARAARSARLGAYAAAVFTRDRPIAEAVVDLCHTIYTDFEYAPGATTVTTTLDELLDQRRGVCQDFAHLAIGCLRSLGLPARYVSGYLETVPPPGCERLQGADMSHSWFSAFIPGTGWLDLDPTNDLLVGNRHVVTAWGRDYADVPPLKGVLFSDAGRHELSVSVDVVPEAV